MAISRSFLQKWVLLARETWLPQNPAVIFHLQLSASLTCASWDRPFWLKQRELWPNIMTNKPTGQKMLFSILAFHKHCVWIDPHFQCCSTNSSTWEFVSVAIYWKCEEFWRDGVSQMCLLRINTNLNRKFTYISPVSTYLFSLVNKSNEEINILLKGYTS